MDEEIGIVSDQPVQSRSGRVKINVVDDVTIRETWQLAARPYPTVRSDEAAAPIATSQQD